MRPAGRCVCSLSSSSSCWNHILLPGGAWYCYGWQSITESLEALAQPSSFPYLVSSDRIGAITSSLISQPLFLLHLQSILHSAFRTFLSEEEIRSSHFHPLTQGFPDIIKIVQTLSWLVGSFSPWPPSVFCSLQTLFFPSGATHWSYLPQGHHGSPLSMGYVLLILWHWSSLPLLLLFPLIFHGLCLRVSSLKNVFWTPSVYHPKCVTWHSSHCLIISLFYWDVVHIP